MEHVLIRRLEHLTGTAGAPRLGYGVETRESAGPLFKAGAFEDDVVWVKLHGGLVVAKARVKICWVGEFSGITTVRARTRGTPLHDIEGFWAGRPRAGYAAVAELQHERWLEPSWKGPRTYGYEWVVLDSDKKKETWLEDKPAPRGGDELIQTFEAWKSRA
jgi:hypothetical protein